MVFADVIYNISDQTMNLEQWKKLVQVYSELPHFLGYINEIPYWFGTKEGSGNYLNASVEIVGLQVAGKVDEEDWKDWDSHFRVSATTALGFEVTVLVDNSTSV